MTTRRNFLRTATALGALGNASAAVAPARPNFIVILADDLGYGDLGCYGHPTIRTPNLDRMAAEGMRFTQVYSAAPVCTPSRIALLTGRLPIRSGLTRVLFPTDTVGIADNELTLAGALKPLGYMTACVGKWHLGHLPQFLPTRHGFDRYFGLPYSNDMSRKVRPKDVPLPLIRGEKTIEEEPDQSQLTPRYTAEAIQFIRDAHRAGKPFLLYLPHTFPHVPLAASERFRGKSARGLYGDAVEEIDWSVGELIKTLKELRLDSNTLTFFTSDNGPWLPKNENGGSAGLLREGKGTTWEGGMREPFLARWPGHVPPAVVTQAFGTLMDILPTCVQLAGGKLPADRAFDGADLSPVLLRNEAGRAALMFYYSNRDLRAVRKGPWKLHLASNSPTAEKKGVIKYERPLLYNLLTDPSEKYDLGDKHPEIVKDIVALIEAHKATL